MSPQPTAVSDCFLADHHHVDRLLARFLDAFEAKNDAAASELWAESRAGLSNHIEAEETHLFRWLLRQRPRDARILVQEHRHIRTRLAEVDTAMAAHVLKLDTVRDFIYELRAHSQSENSLLYQWCDAHLDEAQRAAAIGALSASVPAAGGKST